LAKPIVPPVTRKINLQAFLVVVHQTKYRKHRFNCRRGSRGDEAHIYCGKDSALRCPRRRAQRHATGKWAALTGVDRRLWLSPVKQPEF
jgi:hypothetical protein